MDIKQVQSEIVSLKNELAKVPQKGKTTGGKRIVYAITSDNKKIEVGQKVMRTKTGKTGKLQTVYNWSKDMKDCFEKEGKR